MFGTSGYLYQWLLGTSGYLYQWLFGTRVAFSLWQQPRAAAIFPTGRILFFNGFGVEFTAGNLTFLLEGDWVGVGGP